MKQHLGYAAEIRTVSLCQTASFVFLPHGSSCLFPLFCPALINALRLTTTTGRWAEERNSFILPFGWLQKWKLSQGKLTEDFFQAVLYENKNKGIIHIQEGNFNAIISWGRKSNQDISTHWSTESIRIFVRTNPARTSSTNKVLFAYFWNTMHTAL